MSEELDECCEVTEAHTKKTDLQILIELGQDVDKKYAETKWMEAQIMFVTLSGQLAVNNSCEDQPINHDLVKQVEAANRRLLKLFEGEDRDEKWILPAYWAYKDRLLSHHKRES